MFQRSSIEAHYGQAKYENLEHAAMQTQDEVFSSLRPGEFALAHFHAYTGTCVRERKASRFLFFVHQPARKDNIQRVSRIPNTAFLYPLCSHLIIRK